jgi:Skp family chaperone for outer membrane proteins
MHFEQFFADCGANHVVIARFLSTCTVFNITIDSLRLWSREIRQDFKTNNENYHKDVNIENTNEMKMFFDSLSNHLHTIYNQNQRTHQHLTNIEDKLKHDLISMKRDIASIRAEQSKTYDMVMQLTA